ncbi:MAG TPA: hypothetical protein PLJ38_12595 [bacterium]|nr:hypothetical protein [bacterium]
MEDFLINNYDYILYALLALSLIALIFIKIKNKKTEKKILELKNKIKPFEIKIDRDAEKMVAAEKLEEGDIFSRDIYDEHKFKIFYKNMVVTNEIKEELLNKNIGFVLIKTRKFKGF